MRWLCWPAARRNICRWCAAKWNGLPDGFQTWWNAYVIMLLSEHQSATRDDSLADGMRRLVMEAANGQSSVGSWGHKYALPNGTLSGYGMMNVPGVPLTISMIMARDNGKCGMAGVMFNLLGEAKGAEYFSRMAVAAHGPERDTGHTGNFTNMTWAMPGVALSGPQATGAWMKEFGAWYCIMTSRAHGTDVSRIRERRNCWVTNTKAGTPPVLTCWPMRCR